MKRRVKSASEKKKLEERLYKAILQLKTAGECADFFGDLCTLAEVEAMCDRWEVVGLLVKEEPYRTIASKTGVSLATIGRVARFLFSGGKGYKLVLERLGEKTP